MGGEIQSNFSSTYPWDTTGNSGNGKLKKMLQSNVKTNLDPFGNIVNLFDKHFSKTKFSLRNKI